MNLKPPTDRDLLIHLGRAFVTTLALAILLVTGIVYAETTNHAPRVVDVSQTR